MSVKVEKRSGQYQICSGKIFLRFFWRELTEKTFRQKLSQLNGAPSNNAKILAFPSLL